MTEQEWLAALDTLSPEGQRVAQLALARMQQVLEQFRSLVLSDIQQLERRLSGQSQRIAEHTHEMGHHADRLDALEEAAGDGHS